MLQTGWLIECPYQWNVWTHQAEEILRGWLHAESEIVSYPALSTPSHQNHTFSATAGIWKHALYGMVGRLSGDDRKSSWPCPCPSEQQRIRPCLRKWAPVHWILDLSIPEIAASTISFCFPLYLSWPNTWNWSQIIIRYRTLMLVERTFCKNTAQRQFY